MSNERSLNQSTGEINVFNINIRLYHFTDTQVILIEHTSQRGDSVIIFRAFTSL